MIAFIRNKTVTSATAPEITDKQRALRQQLRRQAPATRAHREPNRNLAPSSGSARQQKIRNVHARDQQHKSHRSQQDEQFRPLRPHQILFHRHNPQRPFSGGGIVARIIPAQLCDVSIQL